MIKLQTIIHITTSRIHRIVYTQTPFFRYNHQSGNKEIKEFRTLSYLFKSVSFVTDQALVGTYIFTNHNI